MPVATLGSVRALGSDDLANLGVQCALANTYHLHLKPGDELIKRLGGLHRFMGFAGPLFTDSGGFQAFSLGFGREHNIAKIGNIFPQELSCPAGKENGKNQLDQEEGTNTPLSECSADGVSEDSDDFCEIYKSNYRRDYGESNGERRKGPVRLPKKGPKLRRRRI